MTETEFADWFAGCDVESEEATADVTGKMTEEQMLRLCALVGKYTQEFDGDYFPIDSDGTGGCNPKIEEQRKAAPKFKRLYDACKPYMTPENMKVDPYAPDDDIRNNAACALNTLKRYWETEVRFFYEDEQEDDRHEEMEALREAVEFDKALEYQERQTAKPQQARKRGRTVKPLAACFYNESDCQKFKALAKGRAGKSLSLLVAVFLERGLLIEKPTFGSLETEFGAVIGHKSGYKVDQRFTDMEKKGVLAALERL